MHIARMIRTLRAEIAMGEVELGQGITRVVTLAAVIRRLVVAIVLLRPAVVILGVLRVVVVLDVLLVIVPVLVVLDLLLAIVPVVVVLDLLLAIVPVVVVLRFLATLLVVAAVVGLGWLAFLTWDAEIPCRLENACNAAQDRHGFAPRLGLATVAGTCLVRITTPSPLLSPTQADGCSGEK